MRHDVSQTQRGACGRNPRRLLYFLFCLNCVFSLKLRLVQLRSCSCQSCLSVIRQRTQRVTRPNVTQWLMSRWLLLLIMTTPRCTTLLGLDAEPVGFAVNEWFERLLGGVIHKVIVLLTPCVSWPELSVVWKNLKLRRCPLLLPLWLCRWFSNPQLPSLITEVSTFRQKPTMKRRCCCWVYGMPLRAHSPEFPRLPLHLSIPTNSLSTCNFIAERLLKPPPSPCYMWQTHTSVRPAHTQTHTDNFLSPLRCIWFYVDDFLLFSSLMSGSPFFFYFPS